MPDMDAVADAVERVAARVDALVARRDADTGGGPGRKIHEGHSQAIAGGFNHVDAYGVDRREEQHVYDHPQGHRLEMNNMRGKGKLMGFRLEPKGKEEIWGDNRHELTSAIAKHIKHGLT